MTVVFLVWLGFVLGFVLAWHLRPRPRGALGQTSRPRTLTLPEADPDDPAVREAYEQVLSEAQPDSEGPEAMPLLEAHGGGLRPRTKSERRAYLAGYAMAINDVADHGLEKTRSFLRPFVEIEYPDDQRWHEGPR